MLGLLPVSGCNSAEDLTPVLSWESQAPWIKGWLDAPIIVVGTIASVANKGKNSIQRGEWSIEVQLHELDVDVENVIRGEVKQARVLVYRYGFFVGQVPGNMPVDNLLPSERRILFLRPYGHDFRMIEDVVAASFIVASGRHHQLPKNKAAIEQITEALVLPGENFEENAYARTLDVQVSSEVYALAGLRGTVALLRQVMGQGSKTISAQACMSVYKLYPFGHSCIDGLLQDPSTPKPLQHTALETVKLYGDGKRRQLEQLRQHPVEWFNAWVDSEKQLSYVASTYKVDARFVLTEMAQRRDDPVIQRNARMLLQEYVPRL
jgi:hypothetical protein